MPISECVHIPAVSTYNVGLLPVNGTNGAVRWSNPFAESAYDLTQAPVQRERVWSVG